MKCTKALETLDALSELGFISYELDSKTKKLTYQITDWIVKCSGAECMEGAVYATDGYGFLCLPRSITERLVKQHYIFEEADAWLDLWCHSVWQDLGNAFSYLAPAVQYGKYGALLTLETLGQRWGWEKTKVWRFVKKHGDIFALYRLPGSYGCLIFNKLYPSGTEVSLPSQEEIVRILDEIRIYGRNTQKKGSDHEHINRLITWYSRRLTGKPEIPTEEDPSENRVADLAPYIRAYLSPCRNCKNCGSQFEKPDAPHAVVTASDGSQWYQMASGAGAGAFYDAPAFAGSPGEAAQVAAAFPDAADGTTLRTVGEGVLEASTGDGNTMWYNSAYYDEPDAPHTVMQSANGVDWYAMQEHAQAPAFETGEAALAYNQAQFQQFMPGYEQQVASVDGSSRADGHFEVRHGGGSGTMFFDTAQYAAPRGDYQVYEDVRGSQWYAVRGEAAVERKPVYENGKPVYDGDSVRTVSVETVRYKNTPSRFGEPKPRSNAEIKPPKRKR